MAVEEIMKIMECCIEAETFGDCKNLNCPAHSSFGCSYIQDSENEEMSKTDLFQGILQSAISVIYKQKTDLRNARLREKYLQRKVWKFQAENFELKKKLNGEKIEKIYAEIDDDNVRKLCTKKYLKVERKENDNNENN